MFKDRRVLGVLSVIVLLLLTVACGGDNKSTSPTSPSQNATATGVTFGQSTEFVKVGQGVTFSATASHSDGTNAAVTDWFSDVPSVATVSSGGIVTGVSAGVTNIAARHDGVQAVKQVRVVPDYEGTWSGSYTIANCEATGDLGDFGWCDWVRGESAPIRIVLSQTRDTVSGTLAFNEYTGATSGPISMNGHLTLSGTTVSGGDTVTVQNWDTNAASLNVMTGTFQQRVVVGGLSGEAKHYCQLSPTTKGMSQLTFGPSAPPNLRHLTPQDALRALGIR